MTRFVGIAATTILAFSIGIVTLAEGVETEQAWNQLAALGCDVGQGFYLGEPMPPEEVTEWLAGRVSGNGHIGGVVALEQSGLHSSALFYRTGARRPVTH